MAPDRPANRLAQETSPYLLQHAHNPVDWHPWGEEALRLAKERNRPILLSIGYSACHWCHVMERESFENEQIAALMNQHFVCIKVDREERPDLDEIYMQATLQLNHGQGGWPMTVFLTPEQEPFFAGTYFPPTDRWGRPGFPAVLEKVAEFWRKDPGALRQQAAELTEQMKRSLAAPSPMTVGLAELDAAVAQYAEEFDPRHGGFGGAPKFPPATGLSLLLRCHRRTGDAQPLMMARKTLDAMAAGGVYDQIGGGFARYSTDDRWLVPHFEKMLYDNALLTRTYLEAFQVTGDAEYRRIAAETLDYILREMTAPEGGFYSATDADSEGVEGKFFVWTPEEIRAAAASEEDARRFCAYYDITAKGNWEGRSIPNRPRKLEQAAADLGIEAAELRQTIDRVKPKIYEARRKRVPPGLDDKVLTGWNGMMISAMAEGSRILGEPRYRQAAEKAADFLLSIHRRPDGGLYRTSRHGRAHLAACLEDYAWLSLSLIDLYEAGGREGSLAEAVRLAERILADFSDAEAGGFFTTARDHEALILRSREGPDGATPSGNAVAALALARLSFHYGREDFREAAVKAVRAYGRQIARYPRAFAMSLAVVDLLLAGPVELALVGRPGEAGYEALRQAINRSYLPNRIIAQHDPEGPPTAHPLLAGKALVGGRAALYVCRNFACQAPITDPEAVRAALGEKTAPAGETPEPAGLTGARLAGQATPGATAAYAVRMVNRPGAPEGLAHGYRSFGSTGLTASLLGFGGYRIHQEDPEHGAALAKAMREGVNVIDTSTNYADGDSERLVGRVLADLIKAGELAREEVIVVSKAGYVQGENLKQAEARDKAGRPYPEMVKYAEGLWHCLHPAFLADQLEAQLDRLGLKTLDALLLHNVEYFLSDAARRKQGPLEEVRAEFYRRLQAAFVWLERQIQAGRLLYYGVSSNTSTAAPEDPEATSLSRMLAAAQAAARDLGIERHHFRVLQCPMNLFEAGALLTPNTGKDHRQTVLELARAEGLAVLLNRPLNAMPGKQAGMLRLADLPVEPQAVVFEAQRDRVAALEDEYRRTIAKQIAHGGEGLAPSDYFNWAVELDRLRPRLQGLEHWEQVEAQMIAPHVNQVMRALSQHLKGQAGDAWQAWRDRYVPELLALLQELRREATVRSRERAAAVAGRMDPLLPEQRRKESLSRKALWVLASTPGVTTVLNGMRHPAYVEDSLGIMAWPPLPDPERLYRTVRPGPA